MTTTSYIDASTLGWLPGEWPRLMSYQGRDYSRGPKEFRDGELIGITYIDNDDNTLLVGAD